MRPCVSLMTHRAGLSGDEQRRRVVPEQRRRVVPEQRRRVVPEQRRRVVPEQRRRVVPERSRRDRPPCLSLFFFLTHISGNRKYHCTIK